MDSTLVYDPATGRIFIGDPSENPSATDITEQAIAAVACHLAHDLDPEDEGDCVMVEVKSGEYEITLECGREKVGA